MIPMLGTAKKIKIQIVSICEYFKSFKFFRVKKIMPALGAPVKVILNLVLNNYKAMNKLQKISRTGTLPVFLSNKQVDRQRDFLRIRDYLRTMKYTFHTYDFIFIFDMSYLRFRKRSQNGKPGIYLYNDILKDGVFITE